MPNETPVVARFTLVVEYDDYPDNEMIREILDTAIGYGKVTKATLELLQPHVREFTP